MSQEQSSKTEEPTPKKLRDAKKKGQVARSEELVPLMMIVLAVLYFWFSWDWFTAEIKEYMSAVGTFAYDRDFRHALDTTLSVWLNKIILGIMLPFTGLCWWLASWVMSCSLAFYFLWIPSSLSLKKLTLLLVLNVFSQ